MVKALRSSRKHNLTKFRIPMINQANEPISFSFQKLTYPCVFMIELVTTLGNVNRLRSGDRADVGSGGSGVSHPHNDLSVFSGVLS